LEFAVVLTFPQHQVNNNRKEEIKMLSIFLALCKSIYSLNKSEQAVVKPIIDEIKKNPYFHDHFNPPQKEIHISRDNWFEKIVDSGIPIIYAAGMLISVLFSLAIFGLIGYGVIWFIIQVWF